MSTAATRRTLFAAASAVILGGGITAGAAASVADYAEPDAELICLCSEFVRLHGRWFAIFDGPNCIRDEDRAEAASLEIGKLMHFVLDRMDDLHATTAAGIAARAHALAAENGDFASSFDYQDTIPGRLLTCLLSYAAAVARAAA